MFANAPEKNMRIVRALLASGWLLLIASLFWDPITPELTRPDNIASPFRLSGKSVEVQGHILSEQAYAMGNRFFLDHAHPTIADIFIGVRS